uniref:Endosome-lysosome associated apoptosis and autophagy regulator family member 2 n=1 Tax=Naja naja TaxID=35670 RepID=A0A8C6XMQ0_NAJNA
MSFFCFLNVLQADYHFEYTECDSSESRWRVAIPNPGAECSGLPDPVKGKECTFSCASGEYLEMKKQVCSKCAEGTYSLGSGIKFDEWDELPAGFSNVATYMDSALGSAESKADSCAKSSWTPRGNYIESNRDDCTVSLIYTVHLKKPGSVFFEYQYIDNNIFFEFFIQNDQCQEMDSTSDKWVKLTDNGEWGSYSVTLKSGTNILYWRTTGILMGSQVVKPILVKNITIEGVAYTSECFPCKPGTFSNKSGSSLCEICPRNTYSEKGPGMQQVSRNEGSGQCLERLPCSSKDFFQIHTPCDWEGKTQIMYKWVEPKICQEDVSEAVKLPPSGEKKECPPCNPGFYNNGSSFCAPCPHGMFSNGNQECKACPAGTEPVLGLEYKWWNMLPLNMKTSCFNVGNSKCDGMNGWEVAGDHIRSGAGGTDNDYLIVNLHVPGFKPPTSVTGAMGSELGRITFVFETICSADCVLYFMVDINKKSTNVVESWSGAKGKQSYAHLISKNASFTFTWAFQRTNQGQDVSLTILALKTKGNNRSLAYDFSRLSRVGSLMNGPSFTARGTKFFHFFNISLCGSQGEKRALCADNITDITLKDMVAESEDYSNVVRAFVCQSTIIPPDSKGFRTALALQSNSLADVFLGATVETTLGDVNIKPEMFVPSETKLPDVHFYYKSSGASATCENGRASVVTMRCNPMKLGQGEISVPSSCPAGTCDGCVFYFLWESAEACPMCTEQDYHEIEGACKKGHQETLYVWNEPKFCIKGVSLPEKKIIICETVDFWLKVGAGVGAFTGVLLIALTCYFWKKNQKLEYKYSKLVMTANSKECELPAADSCAIMEGEDNEEEIVYSNKQSLLGKLKSLATKVSMGERILTHPHS